MRAIIHLILLLYSFISTFSIEIATIETTNVNDQIDIDKISEITKIYDNLQDSMLKYLNIIKVNKQKLQDLAKLHTNPSILNKLNLSLNFPR